MATRIPEDSANAACDAVVDRLDEAVGTAYLELRTGAQPASPDDTAIGDVIGTVDLPDPVFGDAGEENVGEAIANTITDGEADISDDAGWFRAYAADDSPVIDGSVGIVGSGEDMELVSVTFTAEDPISIVEWTITMPQS